MMLLDHSENLVNLKVSEIIGELMGELMGDLTIEQKAKAYDKAILRATQSWECGDITRENLEYIFTELKEGKKEWIEKIRQELKSYLEHREIKLISESDAILQWISWIEKQGEQNVPPVDEHAWLSLVSDVLTWKDGIGQYLDDPRVQKLAKELASEYAQKLYTNQEPINENEPKFHEGDWISGYYTNYRVTAINSKGYVVEDTDGNKINILFENEKFHHLFTIADAKDGDVLMSRAPFIYGKQCPYGGLNWFNDKFIKASNFIFTDSPVHPATKEQRDLLFQKMKEAGYEWNAEKKEPKKIKLNTIWSEEDYNRITSIKYLLHELDNHNFDDWFDSLKCKPQYIKPSWREEDIFKVQRICKYLDEAKKYYADNTEVRECMEWLKSLKERYTWKPSDKQMEALKESCNEHWDIDGLDPLYTLYQELKKLSGE